MNTAFQVRYVIELPLDSTVPLVFYERRKKGEENEKNKKKKKGRNTKSGKKEKKIRRKIVVFFIDRTNETVSREGISRYSCPVDYILHIFDILFQYASLMNMNFVKGVEKVPAWKFCSFGKIVSSLEDRKQCFLRSRRYNAIYVIERWCSRGFERAPFVYEETAMFP